MKKIQAPEVASIRMECSELKLNCELRMAFKNLVHLRLIWKFYHKNCTSMRNFPNKFYWTWTLDAKVTELWIGLLECEDTFGPLGRWGVKRARHDGTWIFTVAAWCYSQLVVAWVLITVGRTYVMPSFMRDSHVTPS